MVSELALFQIAAVAALVGMALGWRGVMTRYAGFYDLPTAWNQIFWGIVIGGLFGSFSDRFLFSPYYTTIIEGKTNNLALSNLVVLVLGLSIGIHLMLRRDRVRKSGSQPTSGWALGLAIGGMTSMYLMFRFMQLSEFSFFATMNIILLAIALPRTEALICCYHGYRMLHGERWKVVIRSFLWRTGLITTVYYAFFQPFAWIVLLPFLLIAERHSQDWVWAAVPKQARRRLRRIWADKKREEE